MNRDDFFRDDRRMNCDSINQMGKKKFPLTFSCITMLFFVVVFCCCCCQYYIIIIVKWGKKMFYFPIHRRHHIGSKKKRYIYEKNTEH